MQNVLVVRAKLQFFFFSDCATGRHSLKIKGSMARHTARARWMFAPVAAQIHRARDEEVVATYPVDKDEGLKQLDAADKITQTSQELWRSLRGCFPTR